MRKTEKISITILFISFLIISCAKDNTGSNATANIMLVNASPDVAFVDAFSGTTQINPSAIPYGGVTEYLSVPTENKVFTFKENPSAATLCSSSTFNLLENKKYTIFITDYASQAKILQQEDNSPAPASGKTNFRMMHLSPNTAAVDFIFRSGADSIAISNKTFRQTPDLLAIDGKTYDIRAKLTGTQTVVAQINNVSLNSGKVYTLFLKGLSGTSGATAPAIQFFANN